MTTQTKQNRYLTPLRDYWYYQRRVPGRFSHVDARKRIRYSLNTKSIDVARMRRDALAEADEAYWTALTIEAAERGGVSNATHKAEQHRFRAAKARALAYGFSYKPAANLAQETSTDDRVERLLARIDELEGNSDSDGVPPKGMTEALLGGAPVPTAPKVTVSEAFNIYVEKIAFSETRNKSEKQIYSWKKTKTTSVNYFVDVCGDVDMEEITRDMANSYRAWWMERMMPGDEHLRPAKPNTANRHIGNMRKLYTDYFTFIGQEDRLNPFRKMFFKGDQETNVPSFEDKWVREKILTLNQFDDLNDELRLMIYVLIETGARTSEICNLLPENIHLETEVPYIAIRPADREIKAQASNRDIPLVGVALEAMKHAPNGFPRYRDKGELVSANLMKAFRQRDLFPSTEHVIYSFRHAFEDRMLEAGIDHDMRYYLMGHKNDRPAYGQKGKMEFRRDLLLRIKHPYPSGLVTPASI